MESDWILDVLSDLRTFATSNNLPKLAAQLDDAALIAMAELANTLDPTERPKMIEPITADQKTDFKK